MNIDRLRHATAADHASVEDAIPLLSHSLTLQQYLAVLRRLHGLVAAWEAHSRLASPAWLRPTIAQRQRLPLLLADLRQLGSAPPPNTSPRLPALPSEAEFLGAMYVIEGSRLGGLIIARHVESVLTLKPGQGSAYFRGDGPQTAPLWREFLAHLEARIPDHQAQSLISAARQMFYLFGAWMKTDPEMAPQTHPELPLQQHHKNTHKLRPTQTL